jgi:hypothetical protein
LRFVRGVVDHVAEPLFEVAGTAALNAPMELNRSVWPKPDMQRLTAAHRQPGNGAISDGRERRGTSTR